MTPKHIRGFDIGRQHFHVTQRSDGTLQVSSLHPYDETNYHFRISTQAGVSPEMTHPFPLSNRPARLRKLDLRCRVGVAHNGVIRLTSDPDNEH